VCDHFSFVCEGGLDFRGGLVWGWFFGGVVYALSLGWSLRRFLKF